jgi:translation initiation factor 1
VAAVCQAQRFWGLRSLSSTRFRCRGSAAYAGRAGGTTSKKQKPTTAIPTGACGSLTHSPFAGLGGVALPADRAAAPAEAPAPAEARHQAREPAGAKDPARRGRLILRRETKHRGGKTAVIVTGFGGLDDLKAGEVESLARELKRSLACGGSVEGVVPHQEIVLQGDQPARVAELLRARGFRVGGVVG